VYGPWGRPDMAMWLWTEAILNGEPIEIFNNGKMTRCFTYVSDIVEGTMCAIKRSFEIKGHNVFNLGSDVPVNIEKVADFIGKYLGKEVKKRYLPNQIGDISDTEADLSFSRKELGFDPKVAIEQGIPEFLNWYKKFYDK
jgi:UDP-glucuronate 4-epimerase